MKGEKEKEEKRKKANKKERRIFTFRNRNTEPIDTTEPENTTTPRFSIKKSEKSPLSYFANVLPVA